MGNVNLSKFDNSWYESGGTLKRTLWYFISGLFFQSFIPYPSKFKVWILRVFGAQVGTNVVIKPEVQIKYPWNLTIGSNVWLGEYCWIDNLATVSIGNNVCISQSAYLLTGNHDYKSVSFDLLIGKIRIEDGVWIGAKAVVCPSVVCELNSILSVGSVATNLMERNTVYQGIPAKPVRSRVILPEE